MLISSRGHKSLLELGDSLRAWSNCIPSMQQQSAVVYLVMAFYRLFTILGACNTTVPIVCLPKPLYLQNSLNFIWHNDIVSYVKLSRLFLAAPKPSFQEWYFSSSLPTKWFQSCFEYFHSTVVFSLRLLAVVSVYDVSAREDRLLHSSKIADSWISCEAVFFR